MTKEQCNTLAADYRERGCEEAVTKLYRAMSKLKDDNRRRLSKMITYGSENDADIIFDTVFLKIIKTPVTTDFMHLLSASLKNARIDYLRKEKKRRLRTESLDAPITNEVENLDAPTLRQVIKLDERDNPTEDEALQKKKRADSKLLIDSLLESSTDSVTTTIVTLFPRYDTANALAKALDVHHSVVSRKLRALSRHYDVSRFGDMRDYLAN